MLLGPANVYRQTLTTRLIASSESSMVYQMYQISQESGCHAHKMPSNISYVLLLRRVQCRRPLGVTGGPARRAPISSTMARRRPNAATASTAASLVRLAAGSHVASSCPSSCARAGWGRVG